MTDLTFKLRVPSFDSYDYETMKQAADHIVEIERQNAALIAEVEGLRKDTEMLKYWADNAMGEFLYDATDRDFLKFIPKKAPRPAELVYSAIDNAMKGR